MAKPLELSEIPLSTAVRFVPTRPNVSMGPKLAVFPPTGKTMKLSAYLVGCLKRGSVRAYPLSSPTVPVQPLPPSEPIDPDEEG
jgi:hypothetical protein